MLFNRMRNYKGFTAVKERWLTTLFIFSSLFISLLAHADDNELVGISYNTIQNDQIVIVFSFSDNITTLPEVKTSMSPAFVEINFEASAFDSKIKETLVFCVCS